MPTEYNQFITSIGQTTFRGHFNFLKNVSNKNMDHAKAK